MISFYLTLDFAAVKTRVSINYLPQQKKGSKETFAAIKEAMLLVEMDEIISQHALPI